DLAGHGRDPELRGDLDADLLAVAQVDIDIGGGDGDALVAVDAQPQVHALAQRVPERDVVERVDIEGGVELAVEHGEDVARELGRHAERVVVGGDEALERLDEVGPGQQ